MSTSKPPSTLRAPDAIGYQKCEPVSGSEYERVPISPSRSLDRYLSITYWLPLSLSASTAPVCMT